MKDHEFFMQKCISLAKKGFPNSSPNPMVGAILVHHNKIIGEGYHKKYGSKHAEVEVIDSVKNKQVLTASVVRCHAYDLRPALKQDVHVVQIKPFVSALTNEADVIHHMDIFTCQPSIETSFPNGWKERNDWCAMEQFINDQSCIQMIWAYDRGALTYKFPPEAGIRLGPTVGFTHLMLQIHYLLPKGYIVGKGDGFLDSSGFQSLMY